MKIKSLLLISLILAGIVATEAQERDLHFQRLHGFQKIESRREISFPDIMGYKTLKGDFHMHTIFSDGIVLPAERVREAWAEGLDVIAITDHTTPQPSYVVSDYNTAYKMAASTAKNYGITLLTGTEFTKSEPAGHLNFFFIDDANPFAGKEVDPATGISKAADEGAFVVYNHPGWPDKNSTLDTMHIRLLNEGKIHAMEVVNSDEFYPLVLDYMHEYDIAVFSNTDIHRPIQANFHVDTKFRNMTLVFAEDNTPEAIKEAMFAGRTLAFADNLLLGKSEYIFEMLRASLVVQNYQATERGFSCEVKNISDIHFYLDGPNHQRINFPAKRTVRFSEQFKNLGTVYEVGNTWISATKKLEVPISFLITAADEALMPFIRQNLTLIQPGTLITIDCPEKDAEIRYTLDGTEPGPNALLYQEPFELFNSAEIKIKAFAKGKTPSKTQKHVILIDKKHPASKVGKLANGLTYAYYEGAFESVWDMESKGKLVQTGKVELPDISNAAANDFFGFIFKGFLYVPSTASYTFRLESDDGAVLRIGGLELIDNDGSHSLRSVSGTISLQKGYHPIDLRYFDDYDEHEIRLFWSVNGKTEQLIDKNHFFQQP